MVGASILVKMFSIFVTALVPTVFTLLSSFSNLFSLSLSLGLGCFNLSITIEVGSWTNPLTGWSSGGDPMHNTSLTFSTLEEAVRYAEQSGLNYEICGDNEKRLADVKRRNKDPLYDHNFLEPKRMHQLKTLGPNKAKNVCHSF